MGNDQNTPDPACYTLGPEGKANLCPAGEKGKVDYSKSDGEALECKKDPNGNYSDISAQGLNWCGFNCGANPHRWEAYFPDGYKLPGDLTNQGYSHTKGKWVLDSTDKQYYEEEVGNHGNIPDKNFVFVLDTPMQAGVCTNMQYQVTPAQPKVGEEVTILIDRANATNCHGNWDFLYVTVNRQRVDTVVSGATTYTSKYTPTSVGVYELQIVFNADKDSSGYGDDLSECPCNKSSFTAVEQDSNIICKSLTGKVIGTGDYIGQTPDITALPNDFTGVITLTCQSQSSPKPVNKMEFSFTKDTQEQKKIVNTQIDCSNTSGVHTCIGKATFDVTGRGSYSAKSKVCIVEGAQETCSK